MTIKQQGGIFGRNPTFNNVEVDGTATLDNVASSDKLRVTASDNPAAYLEFENTFQSGSVSSQAGLLLGVNSSVQTNYAGVIASEKSTNTNAVLLGLYSNNGSGPLLVAQAKNDKNFEIVDGDLVVASGHGIDFSATAGAGTSELFDDYEEGTWTPTFSDATTGGTTTGSGVYVKVGNKVTVHGSIDNIDTTGLTGSNNAYVNGLPFTCTSSEKVIGNVWFSGGVTTSGACFYYIQNSATYGRFFQSPYSGSIDILSVSDFTDDAADILINATYIVS